jgi:hypothetical protein
MAIGDRQKLITNIVGTVLNEKPQTDKTFDWFINKHTRENFKDTFGLIEKIFKTLNGDNLANQNKRTTKLDCDAYFGGSCNFIFEFDEGQHFSSSRLKTLKLYPNDLKLNYDSRQWISFCEKHRDKADNYRKSKTTVDFDFIGGRTAQRAYLDCFRDLLAGQNGLNPTLRISEFEVIDINENNLTTQKKIENILKMKLK